MRILYTVIDGKISGGNNICATILRAAMRAGHSVELLTPDLGSLTDVLAKEGVKIHLLNLARSFHFHKAVQLAYLLKKRQIDLVHTHTSLNSEILCRIACFLAGIPIICHQHEPTDVYNSNPIIAAYQRWLDRTTSRLVPQFIAVSKYRQEAMTKGRGYQADKIQLIYNGIDIDSFSCQESREEVRAEWKLNSQQTAVGLIARLEFPKGQGTLIEAAPLVLKHYPQTKFFIIGDDRFDGQPCLTKYRQMIRDFNISNNCVLLGFRSDIQRLIQGLDIIVLPSLWEGHPLIILESLAARKPAIASSVGGIPEIIEHKKTGLLIPPRNPEALAKEICHLIEQPELARKIAIKGCAKVKDKFDEKKMIARILSIYENFKNEKDKSSSSY
ncbi:MAG: glycosyltransferase family 4 protein [Xenococcaceae cyanobacterium]